MPVSPVLSTRAVIVLMNSHVPYKNAQWIGIGEATPLPPRSPPCHHPLPVKTPPSPIHLLLHPG